MNKITTFETSSALIAAGFPVPRPEVGQFWYSKNGTWFLVYGINEPYGHIVSESGQPFYDRLFDDGDMIPAFTAVDILLVTGDDFFMEFCNKGFLVNSGKWVVFDEHQNQYVHPNPAEAAALAWLSKK